ncbi:MAG TPA: hypothetical protein VMA09_12485 [Candidatus Binataceae bacterium]|nr:hypothetical protein [Candidatus Binataceae bacterium]
MVRQAQAGAPGSVGGHGVELHSESITLPLGDQTFGKSAGAEGLVSTRCLLCHSQEMIDTQPLLTKDAWRAEIKKMQSTYGCPIRDDEVQGLVDFVSQRNASEQQR